MTTFLTILAAVCLVCTGFVIALILAAPLDNEQDEA